MSWARFSLEYRHAVYAALIAVVLLGGIARFFLPVQLFPDTDPPVVTVITAHAGAAARDVAKNLSKPLEEEFGSIDGVARVTSTSQTGLSVVKVEFHYFRMMSEAAMDVQNAIGRVRARLPSGIDEPQVLQFSSSDKPIVTIAVSSEILTLDKVRELADNPLRDRLILLDGVATVDVFGGHRRELLVAVQREHLASLGLTLDQVAATLKGWNLTESGGRVERGHQEAVVRFDMPLSDGIGVGNLIVKRHGDRIVRLRDIANISIDGSEMRSAYHFNGEPAIALQVLKRNEANTVQVARRVRTVLAELRNEFPQLEFKVADDDSQFTELVINNMTEAVLAALILVIAVVFLFLSNLRQAAIIAISIPVAFLMTFSLMWITRIELNMVTMSAIILSIGLLVDDGIVVLENVHRHLTYGKKPPLRAAVEGTEEIFVADLSGTLTTIAVLLPLGFLGGFVGKLFEPLAWTLAFALTSSFIVSVTLIPILAALWLSPNNEGKARPASLVRPFVDFMKGIKEGYLAVLEWALMRPWRTLIGAALLLLVSARLMLFLGNEMLPRFDSGNFQILIDTIPGTRLEETVEAVEQVEMLLLKERSVTGISTQIGYEEGGHYLGSRGAMDVNQAELVVNLTPRTERTATIWEIMEQLRTELARIPGVTLAVVKEKGGTARSTTTAPIDIRISGPETQVLDQLGNAVLERLSTVPGLRDAHRSWALDTPELRVELNQERVAELGLSGEAVADMVFAAIEGRPVTPYRQHHYRDLDVRLRYTEDDRRSLMDLEDVYIQGSTGAVPLRELAHIAERAGPRIVTREDFQQTVDVLAYHHGRPLSEVVVDIEALLADMVVPAGYGVAITGEQSDFQDARKRMMRALATGVLAVYLVLVVQFRSFIHPFTIMVAVPLQFIGVAAALLIAGKYLSMPALFGIILLIGTVVNNSIVLIDYILHRRDAGMDTEAAIREAVSVRYRPIMMTALSDVAGMLPLALELAVGTERFSPIATAIIGGILAATLLTLVIVPVLFSLFERRVRPSIARSLKQMHCSFNQEEK